LRGAALAGAARATIGFIVEIAAFLRAASPPDGHSVWETYRIVSRAGVRGESARVHRGRWLAVTETHMRALYHHFLSLADIKEGGESQPHISKRGFLKALGAEEGSSLFIERAFTCMDGNRDGYLNFLGECQRRALGHHSRESMRECRVRDGSGSLVSRGLCRGAPPPAV
jgi:hypothetical protein